LVFAILSFCNALSDFISLRVSQWFGQLIGRSHKRAWLVVGLTGLADLAVAVAFLALVAGLLCFAIAAFAESAGITDVLEFRTYVDNAFEKPLTEGLWGTVMVSSTLIPTTYHFGIAIHAMYLHLFHAPACWAAGVPAADTEKNELQWTRVRLWLAFGKLVSVVLPFGILYVIFQFFVLADLNPVDALQAWCHNAIDAGIRFAGIPTP